MTLAALFALLFGGVEAALILTLRVSDRDTLS